MPNKTTNYELVKPLPSEAYNVDTQFNANMDVIDTQLKANADQTANKVDKVAGKGLSTEDFTTTQKIQLSTNTTDIADLKQNKADLENGKIKASQIPLETIPILATSGTGSAYTVTAGLTTLKAGIMLVIVPHVVSATTTPTLNADGLGAATISRQGGTTAAGNAGLSASWLASGVPVLIQYNGTYWVALGIPKPQATDLNGTVGVGNGGTGKTSWVANEIVYPTGTGTLGQLAFPSIAGSFVRQGTSGAPYFSTPAEVLTAIGAAPSSHVSAGVNSESGVHGLRWYNDILQFYNGTTWVEIETGGSGGVAPGNVSNISIAPGNACLKIKWTDPTDAAWAGTKVVRKAGSYPSSVKDGTVVVDSTTRNAYASTAFVDSGLTNGTTYYYHFFPYSANNDIQTNVENRGTGVPAAFKVWGVSIDTSNSDPASAVTYTDDAVGMTAGSSAWDNETLFSGVKPCVLLNGIVQYYLNPANFAQKADGTAATINSTTAGDVMIEIPKLGVKIATSGTTMTVKITDNPDATADGFHYYAHTRSSEGDREKLYVGAYLGYQTGSKLYSLSGMTPTASQTIGTFIGYATARGTGYDILGFFPLVLLQAMFLIRYKNRNGQTALGRGYVDGNSAATTTGQSNAKGMNYGETTGKYQMKFMGIEDFWGNLLYFIGGLFSDASRNILTAFQSFNTTGSGYTNRGQGATADIGGYMSKVQGTTETGFIAKEVSGSATTYWTDYGNLYAGYLPLFGGSYSNGDYAGAFQLAVNYSASSSNGGIGARLMYL